MTYLESVLKKPMTSANTAFTHRAFALGPQEVFSKAVVSADNPALPNRIAAVPFGHLRQ